MIPEPFHFLRPEWLLGLALLPVIFLLARSRGSAGAWRRACDPELLDHLLTKGGRAGNGATATLLASGWLVGCLALAGPSWERLPQATYDAPTDTVAVLALTPSLYAKDLPPSRLDRARFELEDLLARAEGTVGLVIVAEEAYPVTPLTADARVIQQMIPVLDPELMPGRGTRLDRGIDEARTLLDNAGARAGRIVLLADGPGDAPEEAVAAADRARRAGHVVSVLALAADAGVEIARAGGGVYVPVQADDGDIDRVLGVGGPALAPLEDLRPGQVEADVWRDKGPWLVLVLLALAPLAFRRGWVAALGALLVFGASAAPEPAMAASADWFARADQQGAASFEAGRHEEAAARFDDPEWRGAAAYRAGDFGAAAEALEAVESERGRYNLGNAHARAGELQNAIAAYDEVLAADPGHEDARHNRDLVQALLDQQEQAEQPSEDSGGGDDSESGQSGEQPQSEGSEGGETDGSTEPQASEGAEKGAESGASGTDPAEAESADAGDESGDGSDDESGDGSGGESGGEESAEGAKEAAADGAGDNAPERESEQAAGDSGAADGDPQSGEDSAPGAEEPADQNASRSGAAASSGADAPSGEGDASRDVQAGRGHEGGEPDGAPAASPGSPMTERDQELEHMLSRVPDDPGGLLREKLRRRYAEKHGLPAAGRGGR